MTTPVFYAQPPGEGVVLGVEPALASWDRANSPGQVRSAAFIGDVHGAVTDPIRATPGPLALRLDIGLAGDAPLHTAHDLDNYLFPLVPKLIARTGRDFVSVWATKRHAATSSVEVTTAVPAEDPGGVCVFEVRTTASASTTAYKEQIRDQVAAAEPLPGGGVALQLAFVVGPRRAWPNLWKATIDALGAVLGRDDGAREWNARDGRVTDLGLHCAIDPAAGNGITIAIRASAGSENTIG
ncbi:hypothetical protein Ga0074812_10467 [Parafrankia irregularis]|uniref:Uncharacterized protein n=1 Tax=Parafrankia irregularis TaxID=795642 RepID=A0A0S4QHB0_9ACTN|nr:MULTISPECIES: hypothetical protein [Parafrankia]MBE3204136.1 hypothetical protein [Parafrankia sp. CH37]CUU54987.1 hypothetical protein Ga0074812_10467 [Parafrankia irregularis]